MKKTKTGLLRNRRRTVTAGVLGAGILATGVAVAATASGTPQASSLFAGLSVKQGSGIQALTTAQAEASVAAGSTSPIWLTDNTDTTVDISTARPLPSGAPGVSSWIASSTGGGICILTFVPALGGHGPASACSSSSSLADGAVLETGGAKLGNQNVITGVVPDGVTSVTIQSNGVTSTVPVAQNGFSTITHAPLTSATYTRSGNAVNLLGGQS